jgi:hypothetical protein
MAPSCWLILPVCSPHGFTVCCPCSLTEDGDVDASMLTEDHNGMHKGEAARIQEQYSHVAR